MKQIKFQVGGMSCQHCVNAIEQALKQIGASGKVDLQSRSVTVEYDENNLAPDAVKAAIEDQGYEVV